MTRLSIGIGALAVLAVTPALAGGSSGRAHALCFGERSYVTGLNIEEFVALRKARPGDFFWFRHGGKHYLVTDVAVLDAAREVLRPVDHLGQAMQMVSERLKPYEDREQQLDREEDAIDAAKDALDDRHDVAAAAERHRLDERQRAFESDRRALESERRAVEDEERRLEARERETEAVADAAIERLAADALRRGLARPVR